MNWVPVDERLPNERESVIVSLESEYSGSSWLEICYRYGDGWKNSWSGDRAPDYGSKITAWMPLPEPYEGEMKNK